MFLTFAPIIGVLVLANLGQAARERQALLLANPVADQQPALEAEQHETVQASHDAGSLPTIFAYGILLAMYSVGVFVGLILQLIGVVAAIQPNLLIDSVGGFGENLFEDMWLLAFGLWLPSLFGMVLLLPPVRTLLARVIPIDAKNPVHAVALSLSMLIIINLMVTLGVGLENLADLVEAQQNGDSATSTIVTLWIQQLLTALTAAVGVGWFTRRYWSSALQRLGIVAPTWRQVGIGLSAGVAMVMAILLLEGLASLVGIRADEDVEKLTEELLGALFDSWWGIVTLGVAAAIGEEPLFRGAAQPRFGLVLTAVMFALVHSNYGLTFSTAIVFLLGLALGVLRIRHNTTTAMISHAVYNITLGLLAMFAVTFFEP